MKWNWQKTDWPNFIYDAKAFQDIENQFIQQTGFLIGSLHYLNPNEKNDFTIDVIGDEAYHTSEIEGEILNRDSLRSSIAKYFGLISNASTIPPAEQGIADMMLNLFEHFSLPISEAMLCSWNLMLLPKQWRIQVGMYRTHDEPMQVVSGNMHRPIVHFEAPPSRKVSQEMRHFIRWFNHSAPHGRYPVSALTRAAIAHLHFITIHPFEDGNGRMARAISQKSLMQSLNQPIFIALSHVIQKNKKAYYHALQKTNRSLDITEWLHYFAQTILAAQQYTQHSITFLIEKMRLFERLRSELNSRQEKVLLRMFKEGLDGFEGGLSAKNYMTIAKTSSSTATRDLADLVQKKALIQTGELKYTRYFLKNTILSKK